MMIVNCKRLHAEKIESCYLTRVTFPLKKDWLPSRMWRFSASPKDSWQITINISY